MLEKLLVCILLTGMSAVPVSAKPHSKACKAYVVVVEHDEVTVGLTMAGLNNPQLSWYKKHGNKGKYAGVCAIDPPAGVQETVDALSADLPKDVDPALPLYAIIWGERIVSQSYTYTTSSQSTSTTEGTVSGDDGFARVDATTRTTVPVEHKGTKSYYMADGVLLIWNPSAKSGRGQFVPVRPLHNHNRTIVTSASTSLLKDGLEQIAKMNR